ncbi:MAG: methyltransferase domain-containing protein [Cyanobacteria bacterium P01_F01_bin.143]
MIDKCLVCGSTNLKEVFHATRVPLSPNAPIDEADFASEMFVELNIVQCQQCSLIYNQAFEPSMIEKIYTKNYSSGIPNSPKVLRRYQEIIDSAILPENIKSQCVVEIGASDFTFSEMMIDRGASEVIAFEPSDLFQATNPLIHHINTFFDPEKIPVAPEKIDLIVMRHVLEHVPDPLETIEQLASFAKLGAKLYIEVPNSEDIIKNNRFYDFFYEHVTYFNPKLLTKLLEDFGFITCSVTSLVDGQHFGILCEKTDFSQTKLSQTSLEDTIQAIEGFASYTEEFLKELQKVINSYDEVAIYGAGNHGLGVVSLLELDERSIECFLDANQMKAGKYSPKTHIPIMQPKKDNLQEFDAVVIIAPLHQDEIACELSSKFGFTKDLWVTYPDLSKIS